MKATEPMLGQVCPAHSLHVPAMILRHHIGPLKGTDRGLLVRVGEGTRKISCELRKKGIETDIFASPSLREWLQFPADTAVDTETLSQAVETVLDGLAVFQDGLLLLRRDYQDVSSWSTAPMIMGIGASYYEIDHFALVVADRLEHADYLWRLAEADARLVEGPGVWPDDFCEHLNASGSYLSMVFGTAKLPNGGTVVLLAPNAQGDQLDRWRRSRQQGALHHVALSVTDIEVAAAEFNAEGWKPMSKQPVSDGALTQWFLKNSADQIIELIHRSDQKSTATFSCANITELRSAELRQVPAKSDQ
ncbi:VOC family protein [Ensifer sp. ENS02]|uniref:VOC family protein n=1 Tax=Ensifer sp. ENS02 TaxID=2769290 RepID=UPI00177BC6D1|nr:VOC family protein [Ensifer sp. ENS02]MBD9524749.1 VOC family protein [Ensifer sp. ENS02]